MLRASLIVASLISFIGAEVSAQIPVAKQRTSLLKSGLLGPGLEVGYAPKSLLLARPEVQRELKLTPDQLAGLKKVGDETDLLSRQQVQEDQNSLSEIRSQGDVQAYETAVRASNEKAFAELLLLTSRRDAPLMKVLNSRQRNRLEQIQLQLEAFMAFTRPEVQERLNLAPEQVDAVVEIINEGRKEITRAAEVPVGVLPSKMPSDPEQKKALLESKSAKGEIDKARESITTARRSAMQKIGKVFTKKQQARYAAMLGEPFDFSKKQPSLPMPDTKQKDAPEEKEPPR